MTRPDPREPYSYRSDPAVPDFPDDRPVFAFDGHCVMCSSGARWVLRHDRRAGIRLLPAQSPLGRAVYAHFGLDADRTSLLIQDGRVRTRSEAMLRIAELAGPPWALAGALRILPSILRDAFYDRVAHNRLRLFGRREVCYLAEPGQEERFLG
jgi:predicted DCC family thiol-disulfide oxidoreductase YuxK